MILEIAGGQLAPGVIDVGRQPDLPQSIGLREKRIASVLGIPISIIDAQSILNRLGFKTEPATEGGLRVQSPSWRRDVTREIDLIEEVGRIYGYENVPDTTVVPMAASHRRTSDRIVDRVRNVLTAAGMDEAMTASLVPAVWSDSFSPWSNSSPLVSHQPMLGVLEKSSLNIGPVNRLRRSIVPSLLEAYRINEFRSNDEVHLFEIASVYLPRDQRLPLEPTKIAMVSRKSFYEIKGIVESLAMHLNCDARIDFCRLEHEMCDPNLAGLLKIADDTLGYVATISEAGKRTFGFRQTVSFAEVDLQVLKKTAITIAQHRDVSPFPSIYRDLNFVVDESTCWTDLETTVRAAGGPLLTDVRFRELFRDQNKDGPNKKRLLLSIVLQSSDHTLAGAEADAVCRRIVQQCESDLKASLLA